jgi:hypothetical protein
MSCFCQTLVVVLVSLLRCYSKILSRELDLHLELGSPFGLLAYVCADICILVSRMEMSLLGSEKIEQMSYFNLD